MSYLDRVNSPDDLKNLSLEELKIYADEARELIISTVTENGGHLSSNLGMVELTVAMHYVFKAPQDKIILDVGHQCYTHKFITGRKDKFFTLRQQDGLTGFPNREESEYDLFTTGHASNSISLAAGVKRAMTARKEEGDVVAVLGDGALSGGLAYEALNDIGATRLPLIIILNDNNMSISRNVGAVSRYLARLRVSKKYSRFKQSVKQSVETIPFVGRQLYKVMDISKDLVRKAVVSNKIFESLGIRYYGPFDGHDIMSCINALRKARSTKEPIILHFMTDKGRGYSKAMTDPEHYHGVSDKKECRLQSFSAVAGECLTDFAKKDDRIELVFAAMPIGTGFENYCKQLPNRFFDVGIAEEHAVSMAAGLARGGMKPFVAIYSTFLQRAYDQIEHDVCLNDLPVTFLVDRAGVAGCDGVTHQGVFDISYLSAMPNMHILTPKDSEELCDMLRWSLTFDKPLAIRYPKGYNKDYNMPCSEPLKWEYIQKRKSKNYALCVGSRMLEIADGIDANVVNARAVKPLDNEFLQSLGKTAHIVTLEDGIESGGFGESVRRFFANTDVKVATMSHGNRFITDLSVSQSFSNSGLTRENLMQAFKSLE